MTSSRSTDEKVECFHEMLTERVEEWLTSDEARRIHGAELYRHLPPLFLFLTRVALDSRVAEAERRGVLAALKYVVAPFDLIPEGVVGTSGFRDDLVLAGLVVDRLFSHVDVEVLLAHWRAAGDPREIAQAILEAGTAMVGPEIFERLCDWLPN